MLVLFLDYWFNYLFYFLKSVILYSVNFLCTCTLSSTTPNCVHYGTLVKCSLHQTWHWLVCIYCYEVLAPTLYILLALLQQRITQSLVLRGYLWGLVLNVLCKLYDTSVPKCRQLLGTGSIRPTCWCTAQIVRSPSIPSAGCDASYYFPSHGCKLAQARTVLYGNKLKG